MKILKGQHMYIRDPHSGAGNCHCGQAQETRAHPHQFTAWWRDVEKCVCGVRKAEHQ